ncbi:MAG: ChbG/HpnK family deacetylase [Bryobacteraceae bacterium]
MVNADDFGFTHDVNAGIIHCHTHGILRATTLMANGSAFDDAVRLARLNPSLDIGCHLVLIQGRSILTGAELPKNWKQLLAAVISRQINPYRELRAQVEKIVAAGLRPSHLDTHKHTHVLPAVLSAVIRLAHEFEIPFIRLPFDAGWRAVHWLDRYGRAKLAQANVRSTDHFLGFRLTDELTEENLLRTISNLPAGSTEFMCHPGYLGPELSQAETRLKQTRQRELEALTSPTTKSRIDEHQIVLTTFRDLPLAEPRP